MTMPLRPRQPTPGWSKQMTLPVRIDENAACHLAEDLGLSGPVLRDFFRACARLEVDVEVDAEGRLRFLGPPRGLYVRE